MQVPLEITFRDVERSDALEDLIRSRVEKLHQVCDHITSCHIAVEKPHKHPQSGSPYRVRIDVRVPENHEIITTRNPGEGDMHMGLDAIIRDAFDATRRQLKELVDKQQGEVKSHPQQEEQAGIVAELLPKEGYGFLRTMDGRQVYFHENAIVNGSLDDIKVGAGVRFVAEMGEKGPQASTVQIVNTAGTTGA